MQRNLVHVFDVTGADPRLLDDDATVRGCLDAIVAGSGLTRLGEVSHRFEPQGTSVVLLLAESHLAVHTWPEHGSAYVTLTTCRVPPASFTDDVRELLRTALGARDVTLRSLV
ncbi:S-adenosylmethionine decarboxylase [Cellulosimicrobium terreum]|nr:S-adenosylmethionine decarboxylase [Cellulosimicrobium terreum]